MAGVKKSGGKGSARKIGTGKKLGTTGTKGRTKGTKAPTKRRKAVLKATPAKNRNPVPKAAKAPTKKRKPAPKPPDRTILRIRELDPYRKCGPGTSVERLIRVDEEVAGRKEAHLVYYDRHGWYCEHGRTCHAVKHARKGV